VKEQQKDKDVDSGWTRTTVVVREEHLEKLKVLAWWERTTIKDLFDDMIQKYVSTHEQLDRLLKERDQSVSSSSKKK
jgi:hypothetical protein